MKNNIKDNTYHVPVMLEEALEYLNPAPGKKYIDCTLGGGGHTIPIAKKTGAGGLVIGIDQDKKAIEYVGEELKKQKIKNVILIHENFKDLSGIIKKNIKTKITEFDGIIFDLGLSSAQLEDRSRGISFKLDQAPLIMEFGGVGSGETSKTQEIVNEWPKRELARIIREYGEERMAGRIAQAIVRARNQGQIEQVGQLAKIIEQAIPARYRFRSRIHPATKTFQALRIATNDELAALEQALPQALDLLKKGGVLAVISYHSLEDRIVKSFMKRESKGCVCPPLAPKCECGHIRLLKILTKKVLTPRPEEIEKNPRSRSAKMRAAVKI